MQRIKKGDQVIVVAGKDKGRRGNVLRVEPTGRVVVENLNVAKKHSGRPAKASPVARQREVLDVERDVVQPDDAEGRSRRFPQLSDGR
jgi:large subunit ribosomal protein L24